MFPVDGDEIVWSVELFSSAGEEIEPSLEMFPTWLFPDTVSLVGDDIDSAPEPCSDGDGIDPSSEI